MHCQSLFTGIRAVEIYKRLCYPKSYLDITWISFYTLWIVYRKIYKYYAHKYIPIHPVIAIAIHPWTWTYHPVRPSPTIFHSGNSLDFLACACCVLRAQNAMKPPYHPGVNNLIHVTSSQCGVFCPSTEPFYICTLISPTLFVGEKKKK